MKTKFIAAWLLCALGMTAQAQTAPEGYRPMAQEGSHWETQVGLIMENIYDCLVQGDTIINGENWKKVYKYLGWPIGPAGSESKVYYAAIRDVGRKVYAIAKGSSRPRLLYDFGVKEGSLLKCGVESNQFGCLLDAEEVPDTLLGYPFRAYLQVERIDTIMKRGQPFRCFTLRLLDAFQEWMMFSSPIVWVEGVGAGFGPFSPWMPHPTEKYAMMVECELGDGSWFSFPFDPNTSTERDAIIPTNGRAEGQPTIDLQGRHVQGQPRSGVYIQDGHKRTVK